MNYEHECTDCHCAFSRLTLENHCECRCHGGLKENRAEKEEEKGEVLGHEPSGLRTHRWKVYEDVFHHAGEGKAL